MKKRVISLLLCLLMALSLIPTTAFAVDADPSAEAGSTGTAGEVTVNKTAAPVEGMVNTWDITLTVTAKDPTPAPPNAQDVVLVIDNSNSMYDSNWFSHSRMYYAKAAAKKFIDSLLPTGSGNRVAIVYFGNDAHSNNAFYGADNKKGAKDYVDSISKHSDEYQGGTNIQAAINSAAGLLAGSTNSNKSIVLLSDGEPTYAYSNNNLVGNGQWATDEVKTLTTDAASAAKTAGITIYSVAFLSDSQVLKDCATSADKYYRVNNNDGVNRLSKIFETVAVEINGACKSASVTDTMAPGFVVVGSVDDATVDGNTLTWNIGDVVNQTKTLTYRVTVSDDILNADKAENGLYPTNASATLSYTDENKDSASKTFPVPTVPVTTFTVQKVMENAPADATFEIKFTNGDKTEAYNLKAGETTTVVPSANNKFGNAATWAISETVAADYAAPSITVNGQASEQLVLAATSTLTANVAHAVVVTNAKAVYTVTIPITKVIRIATDSIQPASIPSFTFVAFLGDKEVGRLELKDATDNLDGTYSGNLNVTLTADELKQSGLTLTIKEEAGSSAHWTYDSNSYNVSVVLGGDTPSVENSNVTFTNEYNYCPTTSIDVTKSWDDMDNKFGLRPDSITVQLYTTDANGENLTAVTGKTLTLTAKNSWKGAFADLPQFNKDGSAIYYTVAEVNASDRYTSTVAKDNNGNFTITNTLKTGDLVIQKVLKNAPTAANDQKFQFRIMQNGKQIGEIIEITGAGSSPRITLPIGSYTVEEIADSAKITNYEVTTTVVYSAPVEVMISALSTADPEPDVREANVVRNGITQVTVTNAYEKTITDIEVTKAWENVDGIDVSKYEIKVELYANGQPTGKILTLTKAGNWTGKFENLDIKDKDGKVITYTVVETNVPKDFTSIDGTKENNYTVTNIHDYEIEIPFTKVIKKAPGSNNPGKATFTFVAYYMDANNAPVNVGTATVETNGEGTYSGKIKVKLSAGLPDDSIELMLAEVKGAPGSWTYADTVYNVHITGVSTDKPTVTISLANKLVEKAIFTNTYSYTYTPPRPRPNPKPVPSAKTGDMGIALYALTSLLSLSGTALVIKKRKDEE